MKRRRRGYGTLYVGHPTGKAVEHTFQMSREVLDTAIERHTEYLKSIGYRLHPDFKDVTKLMEILREEITDPELLELFCESEHGQGYLLGFLTASLSYEDDNEEDSYVLF